MERERKEKRGKEKTVKKKRDKRQGRGVEMKNGAGKGGIVESRGNLNPISILDLGNRSPLQSLHADNGAQTEE